MVAVYRILFAEGFRMLDSDQLATHFRRPTSGVRVGSSWKEITMTILPPGGKAGQFAAITADLFASSRETAARFPATALSGVELLPIKLERSNEDWVIWHVTNRIDALDDERTERPSFGGGRMEHRRSMHLFPSTSSHHCSSRLTGSLRLCFSRAQMITRALVTDLFGHFESSDAQERSSSCCGNRRSR